MREESLSRWDRLDERLDWLAAQNVDVEMVDDLPAMPTDIHNDFIAGVFNSLLFRKLHNTIEKPAKQRAVIRCDRGKRNNMPLWHEKKMRGGFWVDIAKRNHFAIFKDKLFGKFSFNKITEEAFGHIMMVFAVRVEIFGAIRAVRW